METAEGRLASFKLQTARRKVNEAHAAAGAWPHHPKNFSVTPRSLADAGFYHDPTESAPDNVTCVYCSKGLEGWEDGDDALDEHLKRVIDKATGARCPWATVMGIKRDFDLFGPNEYEGGTHDPLASAALAARLGTFGAWWPFDNKKGWNPTSRKLAQAGFYNSPQVDALDTCACAYCDVVLDGWSKNDDPEEEHRTRQPNCFFFVASELQQEDSHDTGRSVTSKKASTSKKPLKGSRSRKKKPGDIEEEPSQSTAEPPAATLKASTSKRSARTRSKTANSVKLDVENEQVERETEMDSIQQADRVDIAANVAAASTKVSKDPTNKTLPRNTRTRKTAKVRSTTAVISVSDSDLTHDESVARLNTEASFKPVPKPLTRSTRSTRTTASEIAQMDSPVDEPPAPKNHSAIDPLDDINDRPEGNSGEQALQKQEKQSPGQRTLEIGGAQASLLRDSVLIANRPDTKWSEEGTLASKGERHGASVLSSGGHTANAQAQSSGEDRLQAQNIAVPNLYNTEGPSRGPPPVEPLQDDRPAGVLYESTMQKNLESALPVVPSGKAKVTSVQAQASRDASEGGALVPPPMNPAPGGQSPAEHPHLLGELQNRKAQQSQPSSDLYLPATYARRTIGQRGSTRLRQLHPSAARVQSALDALLAGPVPTFDSPARDVEITAVKDAASPIRREHLPSAMATECIPPLAHTSPKPDPNMKLRTWVHLLQETHLDQFRRNSKALLEEYEMNMQNRRAQLVELVKRQSLATCLEAP